MAQNSCGVFLPLEHCSHLVLLPEDQQVQKWMVLVLKSQVTSLNQQLPLFRESGAIFDLLGPGLSQPNPNRKREKELKDKEFTYEILH